LCLIAASLLFFYALPSFAEASAGVERGPPLLGGVVHNEVTAIDFTPTAEADGLKLPTAYPLAKAKKTKPH